MSCGIYVIKNLTNDKVYVGQSIDIESRFAKHKALLRHNKHWNSQLQRSWTRDGELNFRFLVVKICHENQLNTEEIEIIQLFRSDSREFGYNKTVGGEGGRQDEETRQRMSEKATGRPGYWKDKVIPKEARQRMSEAAKRRGCNVPTKAVIHLETNMRYSSCKEAAKALFPENDFAASQVIYSVARGRKKSYRKTTWKFEDNSGTLK